MLFEVSNIHQSITDVERKAAKSDRRNQRNTDECIVIWSQKPPVMEREREASARLCFGHHAPKTMEMLLKLNPLPSATRHVLVINTAKMSHARDSVCFLLKSRIRKSYRPSLTPGGKVRERQRYV